MSSKSKSLRLTHRIAIVGSIGVIGLLVVGGTYIVNSRITAAYRAAADGAQSQAFAAMQLANDLLNARRAEKDFLLRKDEKHAVRHDEVMKKVIAALNGFASSTVDPRAIRELGEGLETYQHRFRDLVAARLRLGLNENAGLEGELRVAVQKLEGLTAKIDRADLTNKVLMMRRHEKDFMLRHNDRYVSDLEKRVAEFRAAVESSVSDPRVREDVIKEVGTYEAAFKSWVGLSKKIDDHVTALSKEYAELEPRIDALTASVKSDMERANTSAQTSDQATHVVIVAVIVISSLVATLIAFFVGRGLSLSISSIIDGMAALTRGDTERRIQHTERTDEIGEMARALAVFQSNAHERRRLEDEAEAKRQIELRRQSHIAKLIMDFRGTMEQVSQGLGAQTQGLNATAEALESAANQTSANAKDAGAAASSAAGSATTVASAAEELSASIMEISHQAQKTSVIVSETATAAAQTNDDIMQLDQMSERVGNIVELITQIASLTNLLALNATIEAARAGEAGRGFAVVASEVKSLADRTTEATKEIADLVSGVRASTATAVGSLRLITGRIDEVNSLATAIAAAVEEQNAATMEIARSVASAAENTQRAVQGADLVQGAAEVTSVQANGVLDVAKSVSVAAEEIKSSVVTFLDAVSADLDERRKTLRHAVRREARLSVGSEKHDVMIMNASLTGVRVSIATLTLTRGQAIALDLGQGPTPARVIWSNDREAGIEFDQPIPAALLSALKALSEALPAAA